MSPGRQTDAQAMAAMLEHFRALLASQDVLPALAEAAGALQGVLLQAWPRLSQAQRETLAGAVALVEVYGGGNEAQRLASEAVEAQAAQQAHRALQRIGKGG